MNEALAKGCDVLTPLLLSAMPKPHGPGYLLELELSEFDALWELARHLERTKHERKETAHGTLIGATSPNVPETKG